MSFSNAALQAFAVMLRELGWMMSSRRILRCVLVVLGYQMPVSCWIKTTVISKPAKALALDEELSTFLGMKVDKGCGLTGTEKRQIPLSGGITFSVLTMVTSC